MSTKYKVVLVGSSGVGKTSLMIRMMKNTFNPYVDSTIGSSYFPIVMEVNKEKVELQVWDTAGQERYRSLIPLYMRNADAIILAYDVSSPDYPEIKYWADYILKNQSTQTPLVYLVGNKCDLITDENMLTSGSGSPVYDILNKSIPIEYHSITSARLGTNVFNLFTQIATNLVTTIKEQPREELLIVESKADPVSKTCCYLY